MTQLTAEDIIFLDDIVNGNWVQNPKTGLIDVDGNVGLTHENLTKIPYKFGHVSGSFWCHNNRLTSLEGCPNYINGHFNCDYNQLISLKYCPKIVNGDFYCFGNQLQSSKYLPKMISNYDKCIKEINLQKSEYLISIGFDPENREYFQELMNELEK